ncbi:MAG TPA: DUF3592 domain-containing protein [Tepidisphaeraceae bacterium]|nr:DUF3592 domain-containing protein [Tepidisphaeraceae bacterium]
MSSTSPSSHGGSGLALCAVLGAFLLWHAASETRYALWGKTAVACVTNTARWKTHGKNTTWNRLRIDYSFQDDDGVVRTESEETASSCAEPPGPQIGDAIKVQYLKPGMSRPASAASPESIGVCAVLGVLLFILSGWFAWR